MALFIRSAILLLTLCPTSSAQEWVTRRSEWHGFERLHFECAGRNAYLVRPGKQAPGRPWVWRARFPDFHYEMDVELLRRGFHIGYVDVAGMFGSPRAMKIGDEFYEFVVAQEGLSKTPALEGVSRGGLFVYNRTIRKPETVACIYCDTPVLDFKSWPGGMGAGLGSTNAWAACLKAYEFDEEQARKFANNPVDVAVPVIVRNKIPLLHIVSENDVVVPPAENTYLLKSRLSDAGVEMPVISVPVGTQKSHGHHFTHPEPTRVVDFILKHASAQKSDAG